MPSNEKEMTSFNKKQILKQHHSINYKKKNAEESLVCPKKGTKLKWAIIYLHIWMLLIFKDLGLACLARCKSEF